MSATSLARRPRTAAGAFQLTKDHAGDSAFLFDFDGTLAQIAEDPELVHPVPGALAALAELARRVRRVVIVSARPVDFLRRQLTALPDVMVFGLYGLESQQGSGAVRTHPEALPYVPVMRELAERATAELPAGIRVEYKRLGLALHYRTAPSLRDTVRAWARRHAAEQGLHTQAGRMVIELKPPVARDKGSVVAEQIDGLPRAWYFGDDVSDLEAFAALDAREAADPGFAGVRVSVANSESGQSLASRADLTLDTPLAVPTLLGDFLRTLADPGHGNGHAGAAGPRPGPAGAR